MGPEVRDAVISEQRKRGSEGQKATTRIPSGKARYSVTESGLTLAASADAQKLRMKVGQPCAAR